MISWVWFMVYGLLGLYLVYVLFFRKNKSKSDYDRLYEKILNSDEFKVKGQYDK